MYAAGVHAGDHVVKRRRGLSVAAALFWERVELPHLLRLFKSATAIMVISQ